MMKKIYSTFLLLLTAAFLSVTAQVRIYAPELESPNDGALNQQPNVVLSWFAVTGGSTGIIMYDIHLDTDPAFPSPVGFEVELQSGIEMSELTFGETYYWRVRAKDGDDISDWSETRSFTVLRRPTLSRPNDASEQDPEPKLEWNQVTGIDIYQYQMDTVYWWNEISGATDSELFDGAILSDTAVWFVGESGTILFWNGIEFAEQESNTSDDLFAIEVVNDTMVVAAGEDGTMLIWNGSEWAELESPTGEDVNDILFTDEMNGWVAANGGEIYYYNGTEWTEMSTPTTKDIFALSLVDMSNAWAAGETGTILFYDGTEWTEQETGTTRDMYSIAMFEGNMGWAAGKAGTILKFDGMEWTEYDHNLTSRDVYSMTFLDPSTGWAVGRSGTMLYYDVTEWIKPSSGTDLDLQTVFFMNDMGFVAGEEGFQLAYSDEAFNSPLATPKEVAGDLTSLQLSELRFGTTFYWRMRAIHSQDTSDWSAPFSFYTVAAPELNKPNNNSSDEHLNLTFSWDATGENVSYEIEIDDDPGFNSSIDLTTSETEIEGEQLKFGLEYNWRVRAIHTKDVSDWSEVRTFTTINTVDLNSPGNSAVDVKTVPVLEWEEIGGALHYQVQLDDNEGFEEPLVDEDVLAPDVILILPIILEQETQYFWRVRGLIAVDTTNWSDTWSFTTVPPVGIDEPGNELQYNVYPNPANDVLFISSSANYGEVEVTVSDLLGKDVLSTRLNLNSSQVASVNVSDLDSGIYLIKVNNGVRSMMKKLIVR